MGLNGVPAAQSWSRRRILAIQASFQINWVASVTAGALGGTLIPEGVVGLDFALTAVFLVLGIDTYRIRKSVPLPIVAFGCALTGQLFFGEGMLVAAMGMFVTVLVAGYATRQRKSRHA